MKKAVLALIAVLGGIWGLVTLLRSVEHIRAAGGAESSGFAFGQLLFGVVVLVVAWRVWRAAGIA